MKNRLLPVLFSSLLIVVAFTLLNSSTPAFADTSFHPTGSDEIAPIGQVLHSDYDTGIAAPAAVITVSGSITSNTTWATGNIYVVQGHVTVNTGVTLIVQQGVIIKFASNKLLGVNGVLKAQGQSPIRCTSPR
jgi:hypothetical protein